MKLSLLSDVTSQALAAALRGTVARHAALADNIANVDTPGFIRKDVEFEEALATALDRARRAPSAVAGEVAASPVRTRPDFSTLPRADGNNVDIDREMTALSRNALRYQAASEMLGARIRMLRVAIHQGRG